MKYEQRIGIFAGQLRFFGKKIRIIVRNGKRETEETRARSGGGL